MKEKGPFIGGRYWQSDELIEVRYPYTGELVGKVFKGTEAHVQEAIKVAKEGFKKLSSMTAYERYSILMRASLMLQERAEEFAKSLV